MKILSIKKSADFSRIGKIGDKFYSKTLILLAAKTPQIYLHNPAKQKNAKEFFRVGYTVSKTISKSAVIRNRQKRILREALKILSKYARSHQDYVIIARKEILNCDYQKIFSDLKFCLTRIHNIVKNEPK